MTVVLTGAGGFLGRNLIPELLDAGFSVVAVTSRDRQELSCLCGCNLEAAGVQVLDPADHEGIVRAICGAVVLCSGFPRGGDGFAMARGLDFIAWLFRSAADVGAAAVINVSSQSVYDLHRDHPATEDDPACPMGDYAIAKYATELMLRASCSDVPHTNVRLASLIGPGFDQRVVNKLLKRALKDEPISVQESGSLFGYLDVRDAVAALVRLLASESSEWQEVFNLGSAEGLTLVEIADCVVRVAMRFLALDSKIAIIDKNEDPTNTTLDAGRLTRLTGWHPSFSLEDTVNRIANHEVSLRTQL